MAKFSKYNQPKRQHHKKHNHTREFYNEQNNELFNRLSQCETQEEKDAVIKAFNISMNL